ncbi:hypothetical protein [Aquibacillus salsiterrae]|uniref:Uncharacterized protein n=1 Tax=Aquibacillus salsiterrae TaxID=2950439 RepID=A0A9X4AGL3_9BACI|nr:hypothetical protein [Aquibacillus salsiterrae]MDC3417400.1 hypothetical protein [Aquibacillus salsiterrae]
MEQQYLTIEEFNQLLQEWNGETIKISKQELDDQDNTIMKLHSISYENNTRRVDEYEPRHALILNGAGTVETDQQSNQPLPSAYYEIPLEDSTLYKYDHSQFSLITDRGKYTIKRDIQ